MPIFNATSTPKGAMDYMLSHFPFYGQTFESTGVAINVVPMKLPSDVFQPTSAMLPWKESRRAQENSMLKVPEDQMSAPQRSDDSESILQQIQFTQLKATTCVNKKSITFHFNRALHGTHCLRVAHTECTTEDFPE